MGSWEHCEIVSGLLWLPVFPAIIMLQVAIGY